MYDGDSAGIHAALRGIGLVLKEGLNVKIVLLPEGEDPDSFSRKHTLEEVQDYIAAGEQDFIGFKTDLLLGEAGDDPIRRANLINDIADTIALIPDAVKRSVYVDSCSRKFNIEPEILFNRINSTRRHMREEEMVEARREERRRQAGLDPTPAWEREADAPAPVAAQTAAEAVYENRILAPAEADLLYFILRHGTEELDFESDSDYYSGDETDKPTVADFIRDSLEADEASFVNTPYRKAYEAYMKLYDEGWRQDDIIKSLLNSPDRMVAGVAAELSLEKYQLTVKNFEDSLTTTSSWLVNFVPRAILLYADKRIEDRLGELRKALSATPETDLQINIMKEIVLLQNAQKKVKEKLKRNN